MPQDSGSNRCSPLALAALALGLALCSGRAVAADISLQGSAIRIAGPIEKGDLRKLQALLSTPQGLRAFQSRGTFILDSTGGQVAEALQIARVVELGFGTTVVPSGAKCYSACFLLYAAGSYRIAGQGAALGVHRVALAASAPAGAASAMALSRVNASVEGYLKRRAVPVPILLKMKATDPSDLFLFGNRWLVDQGIEGEIAGHPDFMDQVAKACGRYPPMDAAEPRRWLDCMGQVQQKSREATAAGVMVALLSDDANP